MKSIIVFYSYTGNTKKLAQLLGEYLSQRGEVKIEELKAKESNKFLIQAIRAFRHLQAEIDPVDFDLNNYDLICLGTPVWAFAPSPAMNTFLDKCSGLKNKRVILFVTYHSGKGVEKCLNYMQEILKNKGVNNFRRISIQQSKLIDKNYVLSLIRSSLED